MADFVSPFLGVSTLLPTTRWGDLNVEAAQFTDAADGDLVVRLGGVEPHPPPLVRIHSECVFGEVFGSALCDCGEQLQIAMQRMVAAGGGLLLYLRFDGRGAGLAAKVAATALEVEGVDTWQSRIDIGVEPDGRNFEGVANYLIERGFDEIRLMTNNPDKVCALTGQGIRVTREPLVVKHPSAHVRELYKTKADKFHHHIDLNVLSSPDVDT